MSTISTESVKVEDIDQGMVLVTLDMPGSSANVLTVSLFDELQTVFSSLQQRPQCSGLILRSAKPKIFVAGADLKRIHATLDWPDDQIVKFCEDGRKTMALLATMPFPTLAAISGACVGGGLELALWCDYRIAADDSKTSLGLPEVKLGLVPGWAGTVRLPRIADFESAVDLVTSGRTVKSNEALEIGVVDSIYQPDQWLEAAVDCLNKTTIEQTQAIRDKVSSAIATPIDGAVIKEKYEQRIKQNRSIFPFACQIVLEHMIATADQSHDEACHAESLAMAKVYGSEPSYGLLNQFFLGEHNKKSPGFVDVRLANFSPKTIGIVGAGLMGSSIAVVCLQNHLNVVALDADTSVRHEVQARLGDVAGSKGIELNVTDNYDALQSCDLVIESVVEVTSVKQTVLEKIAQSVGESTIIATNTSAIELSQLLGSVRLAENFCGIHFCHPELMLFVEVIKGQQTAELTIANVVNWLRRMRKTPVVVADRAGFVVNRLLAAMLDCSFRLFSSGYRIDEIDDAMRHFGFSAGPFQIVDIIGADTCMYAGRQMYDSGIECVSLSPILPRMVKFNRLGRKSNQGFYRYLEAGGDPVVDEEVQSLLEDYIDDHQSPKMDGPQIANAICSAMVLEASRLIEESVVADPRDIDLAAINGLSFPAHRGGLLFWAQRWGLARVTDALNRLSEWDSKWAPSKLMQSTVANGGRFY